MWWQIAEEFAKILLHLSDRYSTKDFVTLRFKSLVALAVHAPEQVINQWYLQISGLFIFADIIIDYCRIFILRHVDIRNYCTLFLHISSVVLLQSWDWDILLRYADIINDIIAVLRHKRYQFKSENVEFSDIHVWSINLHCYLISFKKKRFEDYLILLL